jgi:ubiquinol-cytochrome c reductase cytochrome c1 subunit
MKKLLTALLFAPAIASPAALALHLDKAPDVQGDKAALQSGARTFVNYCLNCHGLSFVRYNRLTEIGLSEQQIKDHLMFTADKIGETMRVAARPAEQKIWFGATPPDLSLVARARASGDGSGADWLYTYLRSFYRRKAPDRLEQHPVRERWHAARPVAVAGEQVLNNDHHLELAVPARKRQPSTTRGCRSGRLPGLGAEPDAGFRKKIGFGVLAFLVVLFGFAYKMKKNYWKDVK